MRSYKFSWNDKRVIVQGLNQNDAMHNFEEKYGFWPSEDLVEIEISVIRPVG